MIGTRRWLQGQSLVEFALILPVLVLIIMGLFDFGRAVYAYNAVSNAAREGARLLIVNQQVDGGGVYLAAREAAGQATALGLDPADASEIQVSFPDPGNCPTIGVGCPAVVEVNYRFDAITPIIGRFIGPITVGSTTQLLIERRDP